MARRRTAFTGFVVNSEMSQDLSGNTCLHTKLRCHGAAVTHVHVSGAASAASAAAAGSAAGVGSAMAAEGCS